MYVFSETSYFSWSTFYKRVKVFWSSTRAKVFYLSWAWITFPSILTYWLRSQLSGAFLYNSTLLFSAITATSYCSHKSRRTFLSLILQEKVKLQSIKLTNRSLTISFWPSIPKLLFIILFKRWEIAADKYQTF